MKQQTRPIELLAPAKNLQVGKAAIDCGADAVYIGAPKYGARYGASNSVGDIRELADYAHRFNARVYVTVNTLVYENEIGDAESLIHELYMAVADALIVHGMAVLKMNLPPIPLHASTQCDLRTVDKAKMLEALGFSQLVLARELSSQEISDIHSNVKVALEAFVHGALCVSYSGRCQASQCLMGRSANRGQCAQICRLPYNLLDEEGKIILKNKHLLSLRDFNMSERIEHLLDCGVSSLKIEGRLKEEDYVRNVVAYYRKKVDAVIAKYPDKYRRSSCGVSKIDFEPDLHKSFNRSFTTYFFDGHNLPNGHSMASVNTPKSMGEYIGKVVSCRGKSLKISTKARIANGDGLSFFGADGVFDGFRVNKVENGIVYASTIHNIPSGTDVYRTYDKVFDDSIMRSKCERRIAVNAELRVVGDMIALDLNDERGNSITKTVQVGSIQPANSNQDKQQLLALSKLGNSIYYIESAKTVGEMFIPTSVLNELRRNAIDALDIAQRITYQFDKRKLRNSDYTCSGLTLGYADNVANSLSAEIYGERGCQILERALETKDREPKAGDIVMHTRYCIRRELGCCRKSKNAAKLPEKMFLQTSRTRLALEFDCKACEMLVKLTELCILTI